MTRLMLSNHAVLALLRDSEESRVVLSSCSRILLFLTKRLSCLVVADIMFIDRIVLYAIRTILVTGWKVVWIPFNFIKECVF